MSVILQSAIFVVIGTIVLASLMMGVLLLIMRLQGTPINSAVAPRDESASIEQPLRMNENSVLFEVEGKQIAVAVRIEVAGAPVHLQRL